MLNIKLRLARLVAIALFFFAGVPVGAALPGLHGLHRHKKAVAQGPALVAAANPLAVDAGIEVLKKGGKAIDAAVAIQAMLGLVEPQSSGVGGGAFLMYYDASTGVVSAIDGRENRARRRHA